METILWNVFCKPTLTPLLSLYHCRSNVLSRNLRFVSWMEGRRPFESHDSPNYRALIKSSTRLASCIRAEIQIRSPLHFDRIPWMLAFDLNKGYILCALFYLSCNVWGHVWNRVRIFVGISWPILYIEVELSQISNPVMTCCIQPRSRQCLSKWIIVTVHSRLRRG